MLINCKHQLIDLNTPKVMGIINLTPDSFFDGGQLKTDADFLKQVEKHLLAGATFIDIGGYSSRPGADFVSENDELNRLGPMVELALNRFPQALISIDTFRSQVAEECLAIGAAMINDISAGVDDESMLGVIAKYQVPYIMMHKKGDAKKMQSQANYEDLIGEIVLYFSERISLARSKNINDLILDVGFGFAKTLEHNYQLLKEHQFFKSFELPLLVGVSRKSMIYKALGIEPSESLNGTTFLHAFALQNGANIFRVHDVKEAVECIKLYELIKSE
jgi:dihydropteroate synthase